MSELQDFLDSVSGPAEPGEFGIDQVAAVAKISAHQIPYGGHWALKIVQAAVALGSAEIEIFQTRNKTRFLLRGIGSFALDTLRQNFWNVEPSENRPLNHLKTALWRVGVHERRAFTLRGLEGSLRWDGRDLGTQDRAKRGDSLEIEVDHLAFDSREGWWARVRQARNVNATTGAILAKRAFVCPVPLSLDNRRIDFLFDCGHPGFGPSSFPVGFTCLHEGDPKFRLDSLGLKPRPWWKRSALGDLAEEHLEHLELPSEDIWMAAILAFHVGHEVVNKTSYLACRPGRSLCQWAVDGVVTERVVFFDETCPLSINCFVSAEGLTTDMTTMSLHQNQEFKDRFRKVVHETRKLLDIDWKLDLDTLIKSETSRHKTEAALLGVTGLLVVAILPVSLLVWWAGKRQYQLNQEASHKAVEEALGGLATLREEFGKLAEEWS